MGSDRLRRSVIILFGSDEKAKSCLFFPLFSRKRSALLRFVFAEGDGYRHAAPVAADRQDGGIARVVRRDRVGQIVVRGDRSSVDLKNQVACRKPRFCRSAAAYDVRDLHAARAAVIIAVGKGDVLRVHAEIRTPCDVAVLQEVVDLVDHAVDRDRKSEALGAGVGHIT